MATAIDETARTWRTTVAHQLDSETWTGIVLEDASKRAQFVADLRMLGASDPEGYVTARGSSELFKSTLVFAKEAHRFHLGAAKLYVPLTAPLIIDWLRQLYSLYLTRISSARFRRTEQRASEADLFATNATFILEHSLTVTVQHLDATTGMTSSDLTAFVREMYAIWSQASPVAVPVEDVPTPPTLERRETVGTIAHEQVQQAKIVSDDESDDESDAASTNDEDQDEET